MPSSNRTTNPFFVALVVVGMLFVVTACCYFVMTLQSSELSLGREGPGANEEFVKLIDRYGFTLMMLELATLAGVTFAAIATDEYWTRRALSRDNATRDNTTKDETGEPQTNTEEETADASESLRSD